MIILFGGEKGGTGKTTIAVQMAVNRAMQGREVLLVDADKQESAQQWAAIRTEEKLEPKIACFAMYGKTLSEQIRGLAGKYDDIVIDTRGADAAELRAGMLVADVLITPSQPSQFDIFTLSKMDRLVADARAFNDKLRATILVNLAPTNPQTTDEAEMREYLADLPNYRLLETTVKSRKIYRTCASDGMAVLEYAKPDVKAVEEMRKLTAEVWA